MLVQAPEKGPRFFATIKMKKEDELDLGFQQLLNGKKNARQELATLVHASNIVSRRIQRMLSINESAVKGLFTFSSFL